MENLALHTSIISGFSGYSKPIEKARYVIVGVPYDYTSTYRAGSRFAPRAIREASLNIETYSLDTGIDVEAVPLHDAGDLHVVDDASETLRRLERVTDDILAAKKTPICIGGEHTITLGAVRSLPKNVGVVSFDAHGDLRDEYGGGKFSHATVLRRITEVVGTDGVFVCGIRAVCKEEVEFINQTKIQSLTPSDIRKLGVEKVQSQLKSFLNKFQHSYLTIDSDVLDPAFCPGVANPEFNGLTPSELLPLIATVAESHLIGFDLVEVCPIYDTGSAAIAAARLIFETIAHAEKSKTLIDST
ncbi:MAG TPA: agmatinase [Candidatus Bathyarchaeia archaeon]|nr:agmatinase [Candidatus Bathyarchaeia archaeon]